MNVGDLLDALARGAIEQDLRIGPHGIRVNAMAPGTVYTEQVREVVSPVPALAPEVWDLVRAVAAAVPRGSTTPLGIKDRETFPLVFYRENCADMALGADDIDEAFKMGDQVVVLGERAAVEQAGNPEDIMAHPASARVRDFIGLDGRELTVVKRGDANVLVDGSGTVKGVLA